MSPGDVAFLLARSTQRPGENQSPASHSSTAQTQPSFGSGRLPAGAKILCCEMRACFRASSVAVKPHSTLVPSLFSLEMSNVDFLIVSENVGGLGHMQRVLQGLLEGEEL